ncbi:MAG: hypothetical protein ABIK07_13220 [Planctomycetota bacterium]
MKLIEQLEETLNRKPFSPRILKTFRDCVESLSESIGEPAQVTGPQ